MSTNALRAVDIACSPRELLAANHQLVRALVRAAARRSRLSDADSDDFEGVVWVRLVDRDFHVLRCFRRDCSLRTYLTIVVRRSLLDYRNARWGKWRPSAAAVRKGPDAVRLERQVLRDGWPVSVAAQRQAPWDDAPVSRRPRRLRIEVPLQDVADVAGSANESPDAGIRARERNAATQAVRQALSAALSTLSPSERHLLWLRHGRGLTVASISRQLALDGKRLYRLLERIHARLRESLEKLSVSHDSVAMIVGEPETWIEGLLEPVCDDAPRSARSTGAPAVIYDRMNLPMDDGDRAAWR